MQIVSWRCRVWGTYNHYCINDKHVVFRGQFADSARLCLLTYLKNFSVVLDIWSMRLLISDFYNWYISTSRKIGRVIIINAHPNWEQKENMRTRKAPAWGRWTCGAWVRLRERIRSQQWTGDTDWHERSDRSRHYKDNYWRSDEGCHRVPHDGCTENYRRLQCHNYWRSDNPALNGALERHWARDSTSVPFRNLPLYALVQQQQAAAALYNYLLFNCKVQASNPNQA